MPYVAMTEYEDASAEVREIYDEILHVRGPDGLSDFWKTLAFHPPTLRRNWKQAQNALAPGALDGLTKEMLYVAASIATNCTFCTEAHIALAQRLGMTDVMLGELIEVVSLVHGATALGAGYGIESVAAVRPG
jgi:AhpD family alkylhydroperoxidase